MFFFLLWNLSPMYEFSLLHQVPLVTIGLHRCALVTNYSGEAEEERLSATQHNTTGRGSVQHITLVTKTQTQILDQWLLKPKHNICIGGALLRRTLTNSEILLHTVKEHWQRLEDSQWMIKLAKIRRCAPCRPPYRPPYPPPCWTPSQPPFRTLQRRVDALWGLRDADRMEIRKYDERKDWPG